MMDNAEDVLHSLEEFSKLKPKVIPRELEEYLGYVAKTGDPVFKWSMVKYLFREKMLSVINDFYEDTLTIELPPCPNVDLFNYDRMKTSLLERLDSFHGAPFTIQRICELLTNPRKEYNRADKFMRAIEKNILVVSTREPGRFSDMDCETTQEYSINGIREVGDSLDSTFMINDLGPGPDSLSTGSELNESMPDANHLNTVERVSPVHDQEVSSDSDDSSMENGHVSVEAPSEKTNGLENEHGSITDESNSPNVSSTDMSLSLEESNEMPCEVTGNSVSSTHQSVISNQQMSFVVSPNLGEVIGAVESSQVETIEPCILPDGSLLNEVISEPQVDTAKKSETSDSVPDLSKSDILDNAPIVSHQTSDPSLMPTSVTVECDTSQIERDSESEKDCSVNDNSIINESEVPCDVNDQGKSCDTTEADNDLDSEHRGSSLAQSTSLNDVQSDVAESESVEADGEQSNIIDQSDLVQTEVPAESSQSDDVVSSEDSEVSNALTHLENVEQCDLVAQDSIPLSVNVPSDIIAQSAVVQTSQEQIKLDHSKSQSDVIEPSTIDSQTVITEPITTQGPTISVDQSNIVDQSDVDQLIDTDQTSIDDQSCSEVTSAEMAVSEPPTESSLNEPAECIQSENNIEETRLESQSEQIVQMEIPSDTENLVEPAHSNQPDCVPLEPMDVDE